MVRGASEATVREAIDAGDPFPGGFGFAGRLSDGRLVRDVLGRELVYVDASATSDAPERGRDWAFDPDALSAPELLPAGTVWEAGKTRQCWELPTSEPFDRDRAIATLEEAIELAFHAAGAHDEGLEGAAIGFSGGLDSALLAAHFQGPLFVVGFPESHDLTAARDAASTMERSLEVVELDHDAIEAAVPPVARAIGRTNAMDVQIALPVFLLAEAVRAAGFDRIVLGQGADELFGGYAKVAKAPSDPRVEAATRRGARDEVLRSLPDQLERDLRVVRAAGLEPILPYLHDSVIHAAVRLPEELLVAGDTRKVALRHIAADRLPESVVGRPKKAMQYGSLVSRELDRLARQAGFKRRMDDHVRKYVESRLEP